VAVADREQVLVTSRAQWRSWLRDHADRSPGIWLVTYRAGSGRPAPTYDEVVEEALCFGWIDSTLRVRDEETAMLLMTPRRPRSTWAATNRARVERLIADGQMAERGLRVVEAARANGTWDMLDPVERLEVPEDLAAALDAQPTARSTYDAYPASVRKQVLWHVASAVRPATRARRISRVVADAAAGRRPGR
jgi:uncharacterized protein YdeI (YjbR/CyaY-like superfamily)